VTAERGRQGRGGERAFNSAARSTLLSLSQRETQAGAMSEIVDLRGRRSMPAAAPVLVDPSGRRARTLARAGRAVALVMLIWVVGLGLAGLGLLPAADLPLGSTVVGGGAPATLRVLPRGSAPTRSDLLPAVPLAQAGRRQSVTALGATGAAGRQASHKLRTVPGGASHPHPTGSGSTRAGRPHAVPKAPGRGKVPGSARAGGAQRTAGHRSATSNGGLRAGNPRRATTQRRSSPAASGSSRSGRSTLAPGRVQHAVTRSASSTTASGASSGSASASGRTPPRGKHYGDGG
jgi:hypothetical protein